MYYNDPLGGYFGIKKLENWLPKIKGNYISKLISSLCKSM